MALNAVYRVRTHATLLGQNVEFGVHIQDVTGTGSPAGLAPVWRDAMLTVLTAAVPPTVEWTQITVSDTSKTGEATYILPLAPAVPGTLAGAPLPPQNAAVVSLLSGMKGKRRQGRFYMPGLTEESTNGGGISDPQLTAIRAIGTQLLAIFGPAGSNAVYKVVAYSPPTPPWKPPVQPPVHTDTLITPITTTRVEIPVRTQRRRAIGVGR